MVRDEEHYVPNLSWWRERCHPRTAQPQGRTGPPRFVVDQTLEDRTRPRSACRQGTATTEAVPFRHAHRCSGQPSFFPPRLIRRRGCSLRAHRLVALNERVDLAASERGPDRKRAVHLVAPRHVVFALSARAARGNHCRSLRVRAAGTALVSARDLFEAPGRTVQPPGLLLSLCLPLRLCCAKITSLQRHVHTAYSVSLTRISRADLEHRLPRSRRSRSTHSDLHHAAPPAKTAATRSSVSVSLYDLTERSKTAPLRRRARSFALRSHLAPTFHSAARPRHSTVGSPLGQSTS